MRGRSSGAAALVLAALALRACGAADPPGLTGDEPLHLAQAEAFATGHGADGAWWNPPLSYEVLRASVAALGDGPWGRRIRNVLLGALTPLAVALLGFALFPDRRRAGWIAGALVAADPLLVVLSRGTWEEVQGAFLLALAALGVVHARRGRPTLVLAGVALGGALASKHYFPLAAAALGVWAAAGPAPRLPARAVVLRLWAVAGAVYVATWWPWLGRGYGLGELAAFHLDAFRALRALDVAAFVNPNLPATGTVGEWFLVPTMFAVRSAPEGATAVYHALGRNLPAWLAVLPASAALLVLAVRRRSGGDALAVGLFLALWVPLLLAGRPIFVHSAGAVLPFALLAVGRAADLLLERRRVLGAAWLAASLAFAAYLYPLAIGARVPDALYRPLLSRMRLVEPVGPPAPP